MFSTSSISSLSPSNLVSAVLNAYSDDAKALSAGTGIPQGTALEFAQSVGYSPSDLAFLPQKSFFGAGCGNPVQFATLQPGETVLDLGSGAGIDVFLAESKVGTTGQVIGLDGSSDMIHLARTNAQSRNLTPPRIAFVHCAPLGTSHPLPIVSSAIDCVLSNCVLNLLPGNDGKAQLLSEVYRVLRPGGRLSIDDIIAKQELPPHVRQDLASYVRCISGSIQREEYSTLLENAGFSEIKFVETNNDVKGLCDASACSGAPFRGSSSETKANMNACSCCAQKPETNIDVNSLVASYHITARKPQNDDDETAGQREQGALLSLWDAYPTPKATPPTIEPEVVEALIKARIGIDNSNLPGASEFTVIDVRRDDHSGGHVLGSANWPAQTFHDDLPVFLDRYRHTSKVIFYCNRSTGRGPRCAGWYQDYLNETGTTTSKAYVLKGGIQAWLTKYGDEDGLVETD